MATAAVTEGTRKESEPVERNPTVTPHWKHTLSLWFGLLAGPLAWFLQLEAILALSPWSAKSGRVGSMHTITAILLMISGTAASIAIDHYGCGSCHTIPGIPGASARVGPSLEKFGTRAYVGGVLQNEPGNLQRWILNPREVDPLTAMPNLHVTPHDAQDIACYLYALR